MGAVERRHWDNGHALLSALLGVPESVDLRRFIHEHGWRYLWKFVSALEAAGIADFQGFMTDPAYLRRGVAWEHARRSTMAILLAGDPDEGEQ